MTQFWGLLTQSLADAPLLPFNFTDYASRLQTHLTDVQQYANSSGLGALDFSPLSAAISSFSSNAANLSNALLAFNATQNATITAVVNGLLAGTEQQFLAYNDTYDRQRSTARTHSVTALHHMAHSPACCPCAFCLSASLGAPTPGSGTPCTLPACGPATRPSRSRASATPSSARSARGWGRPTTRWRGRRTPRSRSGSQQTPSPAPTSCWSWQLRWPTVCRRRRRPQRRRPRPPRRRRPPLLLPST
jgi:hypothetical protein